DLAGLVVRHDVDPPVLRMNEDGHPMVASRELVLVEHQSSAGIDSLVGLRRVRLHEGELAPEFELAERRGQLASSIEDRGPEDQAKQRFSPLEVSDRIQVISSGCIVGASVPAQPFHVVSAPPKLRSPAGRQKLAAGERASSAPARRSREIGLDTNERSYYYPAMATMTAGAKRGAKSPRPGSKGERTREAILAHALALATRLGFAGLTICRLAEDLHMSKSGL